MKAPSFAILFVFAVLGASLGAGTVSESVDAARQANSAGQGRLAVYHLEQVLKQEPNNLQALQAQARLLSSQGYVELAAARWRRVLDLQPGDAEAAQALASNAAPALAAEPVASQVPALEAGQGVWLNGDINGRVKQINAFNIKAPKVQRLRHVFTHGGRIRVASSRPQLSLDLRPARMAGAGLAGEAQAHLWLDVQSRGAKGVRSADWDALALQLATALKGERRIAGLHLAPDAATAGLHPFYDALRRQGIALSVLVPSALPADFARADLLVLRAWGRQQSKDAYALRVKDQVSAFLRASGEEQHKAMIGLPVRGADGPDHLRAGREAVSASLLPEQTGPLGLALMGLVDDDSGQSADWATEVWDQAQLPLAGP